MCEIESWQGVALAAWAVLEFWLGKTEVLKSGSTLELILNSVKGFLGMIKK